MDRIKKKVINKEYYKKRKILLTFGEWINAPLEEINQLISDSRGVIDWESLTKNEKQEWYYMWKGGKTEETPRIYSKIPFWILADELEDNDGNRIYGVKPYDNDLREYFLKEADNWKVVWGIKINYKECQQIVGNLYCRIPY
jgi:hypothetical protein